MDFSAFTALAGAVNSAATDDDPIARRSPPGVLVLTASRQIVYRNAEARERSDQLSRWELKRSANGVLAPCLVSLCDELLAMIEKRADVKDCEHLMIVRTGGDPKQPILLRGFSFPSRTDHGTPHLLILLERVGQRKIGSPHSVKERFRVTDREQQVVTCLAAGQTNKEIAVSLKISVQTVKEHIKHLLAKTRTSTRTGMLSYLMLNDGFPSEAGEGMTLSPPPHMNGQATAGGHQRFIVPAES